MKRPASVFSLRKAVWKRFDPAPPSAIGARSDHGRLQENKQCCGFFKTFEEEQLPRRRRERGRGGEGTGGRLDDRMAAFTQRLVSPAETRLHARPDRAALRCRLPLISAPPSSASRSLLFGFVLFLCLTRRACAPGHAPCVRCVSARIRRTKRTEPFSKNK